MDDRPDGPVGAEREWRRLHVRPADLARLSRDLRDDLTAAAAEGVAASELLGADVRGFARRLADEASRVPYEFDRLLLTALVGALPGMAARLRVPLRHVPVPTPVAADQPDRRGRGRSTVLAALWWSFRRCSRSGSACATCRSMAHTVLAMALLVPLAGVIVDPGDDGLRRPGQLQQRPAGPGHRMRHGLGAPWRAPSCWPGAGHCAVGATGGATSSSWPGLSANA